MSNIFGYARVSSKDQHLTRQLAAMREAGIPESNIFQDKKSGKDLNRAEWQRLVGSPESPGILQAGDLLVVMSIDRLGRNYEDIIQQWAYITKTIGANIRVLDMPALDTSTQVNGLDGKFIADLVLQILAYVAQKEREKIRERQQQGINIKKAAGGYAGKAHQGRHRNPVDAELFEKLFQQWERKEITQREAAEQLGMSRPLVVNRFAERKHIGPMYHPNKMMGVYDIA